MAFFPQRVAFQTAWYQSAFVREANSIRCTYRREDLGEKHITNRSVIGEIGRLAPEISEGVMETVTRSVRRRVW